MIGDDRGKVHGLAGVMPLKSRVQHPRVNECRTNNGAYWFFRYWHDQVGPDGTIRPIRKRQILGASNGPNAMTRKQAESARDLFLAGSAIREVSPQSARAPAAGMVFGELAEMWRADFVDRKVGSRCLLAASTRAKYINHLENHILPRWKDVRIFEFRAKEVIDWLQQRCTSWHTMADLRNIMSGIFTKAQEWEILPDTFANPMRRVKLPRKWEVREKRILTEDETARVIDLLLDPYLLICETCIDTGTRISEVTGLKIRHVDFERGCIKIEQRNWRGDIDEPKTAKSRRRLALGILSDRYKAWISSLPRQDSDAWVFPQEGNRSQPIWDCSVRGVLERAAALEGCDFPGLGPHSLRRANITWRQEVGGSSIETSQIAGHANTKITEEYTVVQLHRQEELTRRIQGRRLKAAKRSKSKIVMMKADHPAA